MKAALLLAVTAVLVVSVVWSPAAFQRLSLCPMRRMTGIPCPGCGLTRSFCAISHGRFRRAFEYNPFGYVFYAAALAVLLWPLAARIFPRLGRRLPPARKLALLVPLLVIAMYAYGIVRIVKMFP